jgi:phospholipase/carboxylesterase
MQSNPLKEVFFGGYQWYSLIDRSEPTMLKGARNAAPHINTYIDEQLKKFNLDASKLFLVGFSQGGMMASFVAYRRKEQIAGVISFSGYMLKNR